MLQAGRLRHQVYLQTLGTPTRNDSGDTVETWETYAKPWVSIEPLRGRELFTAQAVDARMTHRVTLRYVSNVSPADRLLCGERVLHILSVANIDERDRMLQLLCTENV